MHAQMISHAPMPARIQVGQAFKDSSIVGPKDLVHNNNTQVSTCARFGLKQAENSSKICVSPMFLSKSFDLLESNGRDAPLKPNLLPERHADRDALSALSVPATV
jgi:hypothetical protein